MEMDPYEQGYTSFLKVAGLMDRWMNERRDALGEETGWDMGMNAVKLTGAATMGPMHAERLLGLERLRSPEPPTGMLDKLKRYYTDKRIPGLAFEKDHLARNDLSMPPLEDLTKYVDGPLPTRAKDVLVRSLSDLPTTIRRHPVLAGMSALTVGAGASGLYGLGKGVYERQLGGSDAGIGATDIALGAGALGATALAGGGIYEANRRGMLPRITIDMPGDRR